MINIAEKTNNIVTNRNFRVTLGTIIGSTIEAMGVVWILEYGNFFATGLTGIAQVINKLILLISGSSVDISVGVLYFILNVPLLLIRPPIIASNNLSSPKLENGEKPVLSRIISKTKIKTD